MKKIICLIDALGPGGAERQMTGLSTMLHQKGYDVEVWYFIPKDFFVAQIKKQGVTVRFWGNNSKWKLLKSLYKEMKRHKPDVVISYLQSSSIIASLIRLSNVKFKLIVSERNTNTSNTVRDVIRFNLFRIADYIVSNSYSQEEFITKHYSFLLKKTKVIINYVDTDKFVPAKHVRSNLIVVAATIWPSKNVIGFIQALKLLKDKGCLFYVKWFGKVSDQQEYITKCEQQIKELSLVNEIKLLDKTPYIKEEYQKADFFCLPSFYEGTPNVICEAMSCGLPIICSDICDNSKYVENGVNGFLFNPHDPQDIATMLSNALVQDSNNYIQMCQNSRMKSKKLFSKDNFINKYIRLIEL